MSTRSSARRTQIIRSLFTILSSIIPRSPNQPLLSTSRNERLSRKKRNISNVTSSRRANNSSSIMTGILWTPSKISKRKRVFSLRKQGFTSPIWSSDSYYGENSIRKKRRRLQTKRPSSSRQSISNGTRLKVDTSFISPGTIPSSTPLSPLRWNPNWESSCPSTTASPFATS